MLYQAASRQRTNVIFVLGKIRSMANQTGIPEKYQVWIDARKRYHLSDVQVQMARELGLNPRKFGKLANEKQEPWKKPLPEFIEEIYFKRYDKKKPEEIRSIEQIVQDQREKKAARKARQKGPNGEGEINPQNPENEER